MKSQKPLFDRLSTLKNLPTLPHILIKLFEACNRDNVDLDEIASIVGNDPSLSAKILKLVNSAYFGLPQKIQEINQAVIFIGTSGIRNMALCACIHEVLPKNGKNGRFDLKAFWWHSLRCAFLSKQIAAAMNLNQPDEAFVAGLLHDIGKIVLWINFNAVYEDMLELCRQHGEPPLAGEARLGANHGEVGGWLLERWNFQPALADAVRYHHESPLRLAHALPLAQIVSTANLLCQEDASAVHAGYEQAQDRLALNKEECAAIIENSVRAARDVAGALDIDIDVAEPASETTAEKERRIRNDLARDVRNVTLVMGTLEGLLAPRDQNDILAVMADGLNILLDIHRMLYFLAEPAKGALYAYIPDDTGRYTKQHHLAVSMLQNQSLLVKAIIEKKALDSFTAEQHHPLAILDEQIVQLLGTEGIVCLPLIAQGEAVGVVVLAIRRNDLPHLLSNEKLLNVLINKGALAIRLEFLKRSQLQDIRDKRADASRDLARRVVHEANNPLSIIKNYLKILDLKLSGEGAAHDEIRIINEEINRVARLLNKLTEFSSEKTPALELTDVNALLADIVKLTRDNLLSQSQVTLRTDFAEGLPAVSAEKAGLKQVFINLIKNAAEAMQAGGNLSISTRHLPPPVGARRVKSKEGFSGHVEISFSDDGPGIPEGVKEKLFDPYVSSKKGEHAGLGLAVAYSIIKSFQGNITCDSVPDQGTVFKIELPVQGGA